MQLTRTVVTTAALNNTTHPDYPRDVPRKIGNLFESFDEKGLFASAFSPQVWGVLVL
jgi:hypothetical protein